MLAHAMRAAPSKDELPIESIVAYAAEEARLMQGIDTRARA